MRCSVVNTYKVRSPHHSYPAGRIKNSCHAIMTTLTVSSKGQVVLPIALRRRLGLGAGAQMSVVEEPDGVRLKVLRPVTTTDVAALAGMVTAPSKGKPRNLLDFNVASTLKRPGHSKR